MATLHQVKILHLIDSLGVGGAERQLALNVSALDRERFESHVCYLHHPNKLESLFQQEGVPVYTLGADGWLGLPMAVAKLYRLVRALKVDIIHTQLFFSDIAGGLVGRLTGVPVVTTLTHSYYMEEWLQDNPHLSRRKMALTNMVRGAVTRHCENHVIAVSQYVKQSAMDYFRVESDKVTVVHRALAGERAKDSYTKQGGQATLLDSLEGAYPLVLAVGRLIPVKGHRYLIQAMQEVVRRYPQACLVIAGDGYLKSQLSELADRLGIKDHVALLGHSPDVPALLQRADIFALPSLSEGCPNALIEALAQGKACIASRIPSVEEIATDGEHALLVSSRSPEELAQAVGRLMEDQGLARAMAQEGRDLIGEKFTIGQTIKQLEGVYEKVLGLGREVEDAGFCEARDKVMRDSR